MATLRIDRLFARYHGVTPEESARFDSTLAEVAGSALDEAIAPTDLGSDAWAVCIRELRVRVELDDSGTAACAAAWAEAILEALRSAAGTLGDNVVVYRSKTDALIDLMRGVGARDDRRMWAWRQTGLVTTHAGPAAIRRALVDEPRLAPAVLGAVGPEVIGAALAPSDLAEVAAGFGVVAGSSAPGGEPAGGADPEDEPDRDAETFAVLVATTIPGAVWGWARLQQAHVVVDLAVLATAIMAPLRARDARFVAAVVRMATGATGADGLPATDGWGRPAGELAPDDDRLESSNVPPHVGEDAPGWKRPEPAGEAPGADPDESREPDLLRTEWGGVWFFVGALTELDIVDGLVARDDVDAALVVSRIIEEVTGAPADDPAVVWLAGSTQDATRMHGDNDLVADGVAAIRSWLYERTRDRLDDETRERLARRHAVLSRSAAQIMVEFSLDDVDTAVRGAGLDLDPGWVWWLGAFVRFRYV